MSRNASYTADVAILGRDAIFQLLFFFPFLVYLFFHFIYVTRVEASS